MNISQEYSDRFDELRKNRVKTSFYKYGSVKDNFMLVRKVEGGYKFGKSGKTYRGKSAKKKAQRQARAIYASGYRGGVNK